MNEQQKLMTMTGEGGPCLIYPHHTKEERKLKEAKREEFFKEILKPFYDIDENRVASIDNMLQSILSGGNLLTGVDSLLKNAKGSQQNTNNPTINTYPFGVKTNEIFHDFFAICRTPDKLSNVFERISAWCKESEAKHPLGESKHVLLITDQWNPEDFQPYEEEFRRRAMHKDFWFIFILATHNAMYDISFLPHEFYKFTRHMPNSQLLENKDIDKETNPPNKMFVAPLNAQFEGLAEVNILPDGKKSVHFIVEDEEEKYCVTAGSYRGSGKTIEIAIAIGKWDDKRKVYSALAQVPYPINVISPEKKIKLQSSRARTCVSLLSKLDGKPIDDIFKFYKNLSK